MPQIGFEPYSHIKILSHKHLNLIHIIFLSYHFSYSSSRVSVSSLMTLSSVQSPIHALMFVCLNSFAHYPQPVSVLIAQLY